MKYHLCEMFKRAVSEVLHTRLSTLHQPLQKNLLVGRTCNILYIIIVLTTSIIIISVVLTCV